MIVFRNNNCGSSQEPGFRHGQQCRLKHVRAQLVFAGDFEPAPDGQSGRVDHLGTVTQMGPMAPLSPGTVENKALELMMLVRTSTQKQMLPPGLQLTLVDFSDLNSDLKAACSKTVAASPSLYQVASQLP